MTPDLDIYRTADVLLRQHGQDAPIHAAMRADELLAACDPDGCAAFKRIVEATKELLRTAPETGGELH